MRRLVGWSSTTHRCNPPRAWERLFTADGVPGGRVPRGTVNQNVLPFSGWLVTPIWPPISSVSCLQIASPNPVPPYLRVVEPSAWLNA